MARKEIAACYCVYDDDEWLAVSVASIYSAVNQIYFFVSNRPWNGPGTGNERTLTHIANLPDPDQKIVVIQGNWSSEEEQRNFSLAKLIFDGYLYMFIVDADEIYDTGVLENMIRYAISRPTIESWHARFTIYWKSPYYRIDPPDPHNPAVFIRLGQGGFVEYRNYSASQRGLLPREIGSCHHMSYARTDEQILRKINSFSHARQIRNGWFENIWMAWDKDRSLRDLHPCMPGVWKHAVEVSESALPEILRHSPVLSDSSKSAR